MAKKKSPQISLNELARFMLASPRKQRSIVRDQRDPTAIRTAHYQPARSAIARFLASANWNPAIIDAAIERLQRLPVLDQKDAREQRTNIQALEHFLGCYQSLKIGTLKVVKGEHNPPKMRLGGVAISVRPEVRLLGELRRKPVQGAIKVYINKSDRLEEKAAGYAGAVLKEYLLGRHEVEVSCQHCQIIDVFAQTVHAAPSRSTSRLADVEAACEMIRLRWNEE